MINLTVLFSIITINLYSQQTLIQLQNKTLEDVYFWDQYYRKSKNHCNNHEMKYRDSINKKIVTDFIDFYGFPLERKYSKNAINGIYYTIQHSNLSFQEKYLDKIKELSDSDLISKKKYAMTFDRVLIGKTGKQKYGEQRFYDSIEKKLKYYPFINIDSVQFYRKLLGLDSLNLNKKTTLIFK
jgi:hypothetical protein